MSNIVKIDAIDASDRLRPVNPDHAAHIAESILKQGLQQPIVVRPEGNGFKLIIGGHRLEAMKSLGWEELVVGQHVVVRETTDLDAAIDEIVENLARHELNALDRALFLAKLKRLYADKHRSHGRGGDRKSDKFKEEINGPTWLFDFSPRFSLEAQERVGLSKRAIDRAVSIAERLSPEVAAAIRGTLIERNQQELLSLIELEAPQQRLVADEIVAGRAKTVAQAKVAANLEVAADNDPQKRIWAQSVALWAKAEPATRAAILKSYGAVMAPKGGAK